MGIPPLTVVFLVVMLPITLVLHRLDRARRQRKLAGNKDVNNAFIGSWF
jgi:hypothetical protein